MVLGWLFGCLQNPNKEQTSEIPRCFCTKTATWKRLSKQPTNDHRLVVGPFCFKEWASHSDLGSSVRVKNGTQFDVRVCLMHACTNTQTQTSTHTHAHALVINTSTLKSIYTNENVPRFYFRLTLSCTEAGKLHKSLVFTASNTFFRGHRLFSLSLTRWSLKKPWQKFDLLSTELDNLCSEWFCIVSTFGG